MRHAVLGNAGSTIAFRVGNEDAPYLAREFHGSFDEIGLLQLPNYRIYLKLMIDGTPSTPSRLIRTPIGRRRLFWPIAEMGVDLALGWKRWLANRRAQL